MTTIEQLNQQLKQAAATPIYQSEPKPLLRGWSHVVAAVAALAFTGAMLGRTVGDTPRFLAALAFGIGMVMLYSVSGLYHRFYWGGRAYTLLHALDHANIFVKIAGAYTPFLVATIGGDLGLGALTLVWTLATAGVVGAVTALHLPRWATVAQYLGLGWLALPLLPTLAAALPSVALGLMLLAGAFYSVGGAIYALKRPDPLPQIFGYHEVFHLCVVLGNIGIAAVIWLWVL
jgi:hemolysin III